MPSPVRLAHTAEPPPVSRDTHRRPPQHRWPGRIRALGLILLLAALPAFALAQAPTTAVPDGTAPTSSPAQATSDSATPSPSGIDTADSRACMRCHAMETLAYRDPERGDIVRLHIDAAHYRDATHAALGCLDCHGRGYRPYPHRTSVEDEALDCVACHDERLADGAPSLAAIATEFRASVHVTGIPDASAHAGAHASAHASAHAGTATGEPLTCSACHDPHAFRPLAAGAPLATVVQTANTPCLGCHGDAASGLPGVAPTGHAWLPKAEAHWRSVRCVDCHAAPDSGDGRRPSHQVLAAADAQPGCVGCHSRNSRLLNALYTHRSRAALAETGWWSQAINNDAYIIGMSRNAWLDGLSLAVIALLVVGIAAHATGRYLTRHRRG